MKKSPRCQHGVPLDEYCHACKTPAPTPSGLWSSVNPNAGEPVDLPLFAKDSDTSEAAARKVAPAVSDLEAEVFDAIAASKNGLTVDEVISALGRGPDWKNTIAPRVTGLKQRGLIVDSGRRRPSNRGGPMAVFVTKKNGDKGK